MKEYILVLKLGEKKLRLNVKAENISKLTGACEILSIETAEEYKSRISQTGEDFFEQFFNPKSK